MSPLLTDEEHQAVKLTAELWNLLNRVVGPDRSRAGDLQEICWHIHAIQNAVMAQAAARAYPDRYRLLGETLKAEPKLDVKLYGSWQPAGPSMVESFEDFQPDHPLLAVLREHDGHQVSAYYTAFGYRKAHCTTCDREIWNVETE